MERGNERIPPRLPQIKHLNPGHDCQSAGYRQIISASHLVEPDPTLGIGIVSVGNRLDQCLENGPLAILRQPLATQLLDCADSHTAVNGIQRKPNL